MVHDRSRASEPRRPWLIPVAAAASVALILAVAWGVSSTGGSPRLTPIGTVTSTTAPAPTAPAPSATAPTATAPSATAPSAKRPSQGATAPVQPPPLAAHGATTQVALPAYFVGASSRTGGHFGLYRAFVRTAVPTGATPGQKARAALQVAITAQPFTGANPSIQPWSGTSVTDVSVTPSLVTVTLSGPGASGFTREQTRLAVQELVWTAQAALGQGTTPVRFVVSDGSTTLFGAYPTAQTYNRPAKGLTYQDLAPIWITSPTPGQLFRSGTAVVAAGESCAFEATTQWQLTKSGAPVRSGTTTASSGCPTRGTWQVSLGALAAGDYTFWMDEVSAQDGKGVVAEASVSFTVR
jgi:Immunoglobulin-like domain of bacterial spore germination/Sporulation and spore germination